MAQVPKAFQSKAKRKAYRKTLRGALANKVIDRKLQKESKAEFYRNLRVMKQRRYELHGMVLHLDTLLSDMIREAIRVGDRVKGLETVAALTAATTSIAKKQTYAVAGDVGKFARQTIYQPGLITQGK